MNEFSELLILIPAVLLGVGFWILIIEVARRVKQESEETE